VRGDAKPSWGPRNVAGIDIDKALLTAGRPKSDAQTHGTNRYFDVDSSAADQWAFD
jgi:hypothetical protein